MLNWKRQKLTDDEFVERIRRQSPMARKMAAGMSALYAIMLVAVFYYVPRVFHSFLDVAPDATAYERGFGVGLFLGATAGLSFIMLAWHLLHSLAMAFGPQFFRIHRLLLKYHDMAEKHSTETATNDA